MLGYSIVDIQLENRIVSVDDIVFQYHISPSSNIVLTSAGSMGRHCRYCCRCWLMSCFASSVQTRSTSADRGDSEVILQQAEASVCLSRYHRSSRGLLRPWPPSDLQNPRHRRLHLLILLRQQFHQGPQRAPLEMKEASSRRRVSHVCSRQWVCLARLF